MTPSIHGRTDSRCLSCVAEGERVRLVSIEAGRGMCGRLAAMGLVPGIEIEVIHNSTWGPFLVSVKGSRVVLGRGMAERVIVSQG